MVRALDPADLANLLAGDGEPLFWRFELVSDRRKVIQVQNAFGVLHKSLADPDVAAMEVEYDALRAEIMNRIGNRYRRELEDFEFYSNGLALNTAGHAGALAIPTPTETDVELVALKVNVNNSTQLLLGLLV